MKHIPKSQAKKVDVGAGDVLEYNLGDPDIDIAVPTIDGNYPNSGFVVNEQCKEILYVISGTGTFATEDDSVTLKPGDQVFVDKGEPFRYEGCRELVLITACTPAWKPEQHKEVNT